MAVSVDSMSTPASSSVEAKRSVMSIAFSVLATGAAIFGAGAALASPSSVCPGDGLLAFHVE
jgi:hypothetical protein